MKAFLLPGITGLLLGLILRWTQLCYPAAMRQALSLRVSHALRSLLYFIGAGMALTALLMWLAVIDVDEVVVLPLSAGTLAGGAVFGVAVALAGYTPLTAFAGLGGGKSGEAFCTLAGCFAGTLLLPLLEGPLSALQAIPPFSATTLFSVTLDEPYLLGGGLLAQGMAGLLLMTIAACIPSNRRAAARSAAPDEAAAASPAADAESPVEPTSTASPHADEAACGTAELLRLPAPPPIPRLSAPNAQEEELPPVSDAAEDAFIALLPGEEPLVVDTGDDDPSESHDAQEPGDQ